MREALLSVLSDEGNAAAAHVADGIWILTACDGERDEEKKQPRCSDVLNYLPLLPRSTKLRRSCCFSSMVYTGIGICGSAVWNRCCRCCWSRQSQTLNAFEVRNAFYLNVKKDHILMNQYVVWWKINHLIWFAHIRPSRSSKVQSRISILPGSEFPADLEFSRQLWLRLRCQRTVVTVAAHSIWQLIKRKRKKEKKRKRNTNKNFGKVLPD